MMAKADDALNAVARRQSQAPDAFSDSENEHQSSAPSAPENRESLQIDWALFRELAEVRHSNSGQTPAEHILRRLTSLSIDC